ncbi:hypothetical protein [Mesorhizobium sp.]|uniref:hypothetical protein n=1 Tax=Mesorhizobium sp. TaxID=1871066 RepID=UPI0025DEB382|nr:hypothetical protein [Mesorhizobium sp.]
MLLVLYSLWGILVDAVNAPDDLEMVKTTVPSLIDLALGTPWYASALALLAAFVIMIVVLWPDLTLTREMAEARRSLSKDSADLRAEITRMKDDFYEWRIRRVDPAIAEVPILQDRVTKELAGLPNIESNLKNALVSLHKVEGRLDAVELRFDVMDAKLAKGT